MYHARAFMFFVAPFSLVAHAQVDLDAGDVPTPCKTICKPITDLSDKCDIDLVSDKDADESHLQNQCICTNKSFDVAKFAAYCADCMHQTQKSKRDDGHADAGDLKHIDGLLSLCGFPSATYNPTATSEVASITVSVQTPTAISQLTTTIESSRPGSGATSATGGSALPTTNSPDSAGAAPTMQAAYAGGAAAAAYLMG